MSVTSWSWSRWETYLQCPLKFRLRYLDKIEEGPKSPAQLKGIAVHDEVAKYIAYPPDQPAPPVPKVASKYSGYLEQVRQHDDKVVEQQWGFDRHWRPTGWFDRRQGHETWLRAILDAGVLYPDMVVDAIDWKTGKRYGHNDDQMELFAIGVMCHFAPAIKVNTHLVYLDVGGDPESAEFDVKDKAKLIAKWEKKTAPMFVDTVFPPRPNDKCVFCDFARSKGRVDKEGKPLCRFG